MSLFSSWSSWDRWSGNKNSFPGNYLRPKRGKGIWTFMMEGWCLDNLDIYKLPRKSKSSKTSWWQLKYFLCSSLFGEDSQFDSYFSNGLKPPTREEYALGIVDSKPLLFNNRLYGKTVEKTIQKRVFLRDFQEMGYDSKVFRFTTS